MNVDEAIKKIGEITEKELEKNPDAISWDDEINIKNSIVSNLNLENFFKDQSQLENMYIYEMFDNKWNIPYKTKVEMVRRWLKYLPRMSNLTVEIDPDKIN